MRRAMSAPATPMTAEDLEAASAAYPRAELWDGVLFVREPATPWHGGVAARVVAALAVHPGAARRGRVFDSSAGWLLAREPDRVLQPDASFVSFERLRSLPRRGFPRVTPDLVVEVRSPDSSWPETYAKGTVWVGHGARVVWLLNPSQRQAIVLRPNAPPVVVGPGQSLDAAPVLDLRVPLDDLLRDVPADA
jgi:Uma2 family endonuclease